MGRPSKLSEQQWAVVEKRVLAGEPIRALAREIKVSEGAIRAKVSTRVAEIKDVANQIVNTQQALNKLTISAQVSAQTFAADLLAISGHLLGAARFGAATAHRLAGIANAKAELVDDAAPLDAEGIENLKGISVLTNMANSASEIGINLMSANKKTFEAMPRDPGIETIPDNPIQAAESYQRLINGR